MQYSLRKYTVYHIHDDTFVVTVFTFNCSVHLKLRWTEILNEHVYSHKAVIVTIKY